MESAGMRAIRDLEDFISEPIFSTYSVEQLESLKKRLSNNGDLHDYNVKTNERTPGAAIGKLIAFRGEHGKPTDSKTIAQLQPIEIKNYVNSLRESAVHWFNLHSPDLATELTTKEREALERLNRIGMGSFRPLVMSVFKNEQDPSKRTEFCDHVERFIFIVSLLSQARTTYRNSVFHSASREFNRGKINITDIKNMLEKNLKDYCFHDDGKFDSRDFYDYLHKRFNSGDRSGYYSWHGLRYFLYEYELDHLSKSTQKKVSWEDLLKTPKDKISIEHVFPQTLTENWRKAFSGVDRQYHYLYCGSIGNLLLLSMSKNASLQNDDFADKKTPKKSGPANRDRKGYSDGSHSEIKVAQYDNWTPEVIEERGLEMLTFMERRWKFQFRDDQAKKDLLFLRKEAPETAD